MLSHFICAGLRKDYHTWVYYMFVKSVLTLYSWYILLCKCYLLIFGWILIVDYFSFFFFLISYIFKYLRLNFLV